MRFVVDGWPNNHSEHCGGLNAMFLERGRARSDRQCGNGQALQKLTLITWVRFGAG